jgi:hypothetical protein
MFMVEGGGCSEGRRTDLVSTISISAVHPQLVQGQIISVSFTHLCLCLCHSHSSKPPLNLSDPSLADPLAHSPGDRILSLPSRQTCLALSSKSLQSHCSGCYLSSIDSAALNHREPASLLRCAGCKVVHYCSKVSTLSASALVYHSRESREKPRYRRDPEGGARAPRDLD